MTTRFVDYGFADCPNRERQPDPPPSAYINGVVTPHAAFLALNQGRQIMAAISNALALDMLRDAFVTRNFRHALRPVIKVERFNAGARSREHDAY
jgi:hypothetical protein